MAKRIIVSQIGARHRYTIPYILNKRRLLYALYTDSCQYSVMGNISRLICSLGIKVPILQRLSKRRLNIPKDKVFCSDILIFKRFLYKKSRTFIQYDVLAQSLSEVFKRKNIDEADCVYNMYYENIDFIKYAKSLGKTILVDIYENPEAFRALISEIKNNPEYNCIGNLIDLYNDKALYREKYIDELLNIADYYTVPSKFVFNTLMKYKAFKPERAFLLPYPASIKSRVYNYKPIKHKLIWVGNDPIRKGLIYCAKAATVLKQKYPDLDFRIIGVVDERVVSSPNFQDLNFIGILNAEELKKEYESAEAYVFPTLYEGYAGTVIEAASCGCPIITTEGAGTDMEEFPAIYIPRYDYKSIVTSVIKLFEDPSFRDKLSYDTFEYSAKLSPEEYENNLINIISKI